MRKYDAEILVKLHTKKILSSYELTNYVIRYVDFNIF